MSPAKHSMCPALRGLVLAALPLLLAAPAWALKIPVKCGDLLVGNIDVAVSASGAGIVGGFTSVVGGPPPTLKAAATACDEDHWNWYQVVTKDNQIPGAPYVDPPKGGLGTQWADDLPWYFDEKPVPNPLPAGKVADVPANAFQLSTNAVGATLNYFDFPGGAPGLKLEFKTWLVSLNADSSLHSFHEGFSWTFDIGNDGLGTKTAGGLALLQAINGNSPEYKDLIGGFATAVPEPQAALLLLLGLAGLGLRHRITGPAPCASCQPC